MARNEEKAQSMLNRWLKYKGGLGESGGDGRRPFLSSSVDNLNDCDKWRKQVVREVAQKVSQIQNGGLGEHRIRDLNDEINKLLREKWHWERRLRELGGADYSRSSRITDADGKIVTGHGGYMYFGAARELPGVKELLEQNQALRDYGDKDKKSRAELYRLVDPSYYGLDDESPQLKRLEREAERAAWKDEFARQKAKYGGDAINEVDVIEEVEEALARGQPERDLKIPTKQEIEQQMLERKKKSLMAKLSA